MSESILGVQRFGGVRIEVRAEGEHPDLLTLYVQTLLDTAAVLHELPTVEVAALAVPARACCGEFETGSGEHGDECTRVAREPVPCLEGCTAGRDGDVPCLGCNGEGVER